VRESPPRGGSPMSSSPIARARPISRARLRPELRVHRLALEVRLGCSEAERAVPQSVELDATIRFAEPPAGCTSDRLEDTVCYAELATVAREIVSAREFRLVEHLGHELHGAFRER